MPTATIPGKQLWTARIITGLAASFLLLDATMKLLKLTPAVEATAALGYPTSSVVLIGAIQLACLVLYLVPSTSFLGAVLLTGYLGGAVASQVRVGNPLFSHILFSTYGAALIWGGLYLRDARLRILVPVRARG